MDSKDIFIKLCDKYELNYNDRKIIYKYIKNIMNHKEFKKRCGKEFSHHRDVTLGEHILEDTIITYIMIKSSNNKNINLKLALKISMMHDLYTKPWQNSLLKKNKLIHRHGFSHPLEAVINSITWFRKDFRNDKDAKIIIDGILHHMYPFPVLSYIDSDNNILELNNYNLIKKIPKKYLNMIYESTNRNRIGNLSLSKSKYLEGRIMSRSDKLATRKELSKTSDVLAFVTGKNKRLKKD